MQWNAAASQPNKFASPRQALCIINTFIEVIVIIIPRGPFPLCQSLKAMKWLAPTILKSL